VAVLVDGSYQAGPQDGENIYVPRTNEELEKFQEIVKSAMGYDAQRGDQVEIANVPFAAQDNTEEQLLGTAAEHSFWLQIGRYGVYMILGLLGYFLLARPLIKVLTRGQDTMATSLPRTVQELEEAMGAASELSQGSPERQQLTASGTPDQIANQKLRSQVNTLVLEEPERAAEILRIWLRA
jgi:flagellar M-ring protein FliF